MKKVVLSLTPQRFVYHISCFVAKSNLSTFVAKIFLLGVSTQMSDSDEVMSLVESVSDGNLSESSDLDGMEVIGILQPYAEKLLAHTSEEEEDKEEQQDGLTPVVLHARFEGNVSVNAWLVIGHIFFFEITRR